MDQDMTADEKKESDDDSSYTYHEVPVELLTEIFIYLPVKSLIRFTCVCKSWLDLIKGDTRLALKQFLTKTKSSLSLASSPSTLMDNVDYYIEDKCSTSDTTKRFLLYNFTEKKTLRRVKYLEFDPGLNLYVSNSCHGIMSMFVQSNNCDEPRRCILLVNPVIREVVQVAVSPTIPMARWQPDIGIGYDPTSLDYKVVAITKRCDPQQADVYSVRNGSWHSLPANATKPLQFFDTLNGRPVLNANGRILNWLGYSHSAKVRGLVSFDIVDEIFREMPIPDYIISPKTKAKIHLLPSSQCLACLCSYSYDDSFYARQHFNSMDIWILSGDIRDHQMAWSKHVSIRFPDPNRELIMWPVNFWLNDNELLVNVKIRRMNVQTKKKSVGEVFHYNICTKHLQRIGRLGVLEEADFNHVVGYNESLVSIKRVCMSSHHDDVSLEANGNCDKDAIRHYFIREVNARNSEVCWNYNFTLV